MPPRLAAIALLVLAQSAFAEDWPQWMGPGRDNVWREDGIVTEFPATGPKVVWRTPVRGGYAGPAVAAGRLFITDYVSDDNLNVANFERKRVQGTERVLCLDEVTGKPQWTHEYPVKYSVSYPAGPRCTPTVDEDRVYTLGAEGHLFCLATKTGEVIWSKHFPTDYQTTTNLWGYTGHPLVDGEKLICIVGGPGSHVVAFDKHTGQELWRAIDAEAQGYAPPTIIEAGGVRQLILLRPDAVTSVDPETGREYWSVPYEATSGSIIMSPIQWTDYLYAGGYSNKNILLELGASSPTAKILWRDVAKKGISPVNVQPILVDNIIYGFDQKGLLMAVELPSGERLWETPQPIGKRQLQTATAFIVKNGDRFILFNELGELILARMTRAGYEEIDRAKVIEQTGSAFGRKVVWSMPAYANRHAYLRNDRECVCVELGK